MKQFDTKEEKVVYLKKIKRNIYLAITSLTLCALLWAGVVWLNKAEFFYAGECIFFENGDVYKVEKISKYEEAFHLELLYHKEPKITRVGTKVTKSRDDLALAGVRRINCP